MCGVKEVLVYNKNQHLYLASFGSAICFYFALDVHGIWDRK